MNNKVYKIVQLLVIFLFVVSFVLQAQPTAPLGGVGLGGQPVGGAGVPLDGGVLSILLAAGVAYSWLAKKKKKKEQEE